ncbi:MAG: zf-TFIIB domain-containing protein [Candidatus Auribacterota bacterium]
MKCINCSVELVADEYKGLTIRTCPECENIWVEKDTLREFKDRTDEFLCWVDVDLWKKDEHHIVTRADKNCTVCKEYLYNVDYRGSHIVLPVCFSCKGVWISAENRQKLFSYLDNVLTNETLTGYLKEIGHEAAELVSGKESLKEELHDLKTILVLVEYRIFSKIPVLERIISGFPK